TITAGPAQLTVRIEAVAPAPALRAPHFQPGPAPADTPDREDLQARFQLFRGEVARFKEQRERIEEEQGQRRLELEQKEREVQARSAELERDRALWHQRREEIERECRQREKQAVAPLDLRQREQAL